MPYHAAIAPELAAMFGRPGNPTPHITCDGCGERLEVLTRSGIPAQWFMKRKQAPGWAITYRDEGGLVAKCPTCKPPPAEPKGPGA